MIAILEPVCAGIMVSLISKHLLINLGVVWRSCSVEEIVVEEPELEEEGEAVSSTNTTISDVDIHVHCHG